MPDFIMVRLPKTLASRVDDTRHATVSREAFVRQAVEAALASKEPARPAPRASAPDVERAKEAAEYVLPKIAPRRR